MGAPRSPRCTRSADAELRGCVQGQGIQTLAIDELGSTALSSHSPTTRLVANRGSHHLPEDRALRRLDGLWSEGAAVRQLFLRGTGLPGFVSAGAPGESKRLWNGHPAASHPESIWMERFRFPSLLFPLLPLGHLSEFKESAETADDHGVLRLFVRPAGPWREGALFALPLLDFSAPLLAVLLPPIQLLPDVAHHVGARSVACLDVRIAAPKIYLWPKAACLLPELFAATRL
mmetsp:Transcript_634/g.1505  ORF Transcript_634/g.1505 Transcript_634/m.1505 type:complete len:232 (+) Transcript_634:23-718(+)